MGFPDVGLGKFCALTLSMFAVQVILTSTLVAAAETQFGPQSPPTRGAIWPKPKHFVQLADIHFIVDPNEFQFQVVGQSCSILDRALERYMIHVRSAVIYGKVDAIRKEIKSVEELRATTLSALRIDLKSPCDEYPSEAMDESYTLTLSHRAEPDMSKNNLSANSIWGVLRGLESFSQILVPDTAGRVYTFQGICIEDSPRFPHRGLLLDTSRHFFPLTEILRALDGMAYSKMNVFHWHIVDDQSFPYQSLKFPELSSKGAYHPELAVYTPQDVQTVVNYARDRGIRVIPEFDMPAHTRSWGESIKGLLTKCGRTQSVGPIDPSSQKNFEFLAEFLAEVASVFKDKYIHLGGDEVPTKCWQESPEIAGFMRASNFSGDFSRLSAHFFTHVLDITYRVGVKPMFWEEILDLNVDVDKDAIIQAWRVDNTQTIKPIVARGHKAVYSACWYMNEVHKTWRDYYKCDVLDFPGSAEEKGRVLGGEACAWGEWIDESNVSPHIWPRACAAAERLWTYAPEPVNVAAARIEEHSCRLKRRGVPSAPANGPGFCPVLRNAPPPATAQTPTPGVQPIKETTTLVEVQDFFAYFGFNKLI